MPPSGSTPGAPRGQKSSQTHHDLPLASFSSDGKIPRGKERCQTGSHFNRFQIQFLSEICCIFCGISCKPWKKSAIENTLIQVFSIPNAYFRLKSLLATLVLKCIGWPSRPFVHRGEKEGDSFFLSFLPPFSCFSLSLFLTVETAGEAKQRALRERKERKTVRIKIKERRLSD